MTWARVGDLCRLVNGKAFKPSDWGNSGEPIIRIQNLNDAEKPFNYWSGSLDRQVIVQTGDVLLAWSGTPGTSFGVHIWNRGSGILNQHIFRVDLDQAKITPRWFLHAVNGQLTKLIAQAHGGVGLQHVTRPMVDGLEIPLPSLDEQLRIAAILDKADALRRNRKRTADLLDSLKQAIFLEIFGDLNGYQVITVGQSLSRPLRNGLSPAKAGAFPGKVLTLSAVTGGTFKPDAAKQAMFANEPPPNQFVEQGEFLICRGNGNKSLVGVGVFASRSMPDTLFPDTIIAGQIDPHKFHPQFFQDVWNGKLVRSQIEKSARTTNGTFKVNQSGLEAISIPMPDISLQKNYGEKVSLVQQAKVTVSKQLNFLNTLFSSLQSRAFSGQL